MLRHENGLTYPAYESNQKFRDCIDLLLISGENESHYVHIKDFDRSMCNKTKNKNQKYFCKCCLQCFSGEKDLIEHKENCLIINGKQSVKLISGSISFKNYFKLLPVPFKIYADFERILKGVKSSGKNNGSYTKKDQDHVPCSFVYKVVCIDSHLIMKEISKFDENVSVIRNGLEKCMAFTINTNLVFIDRMQSMDSRLDSLVKNLSDYDFKYLCEEFSGKF